MPLPVLSEFGCPVSPAVRTCVYLHSRVAFCKEKMESSRPLCTYLDSLLEDVPNSMAVGGRPEQPSLPRS
eukprot:2041068-Rhodomonas_salina.1